MNLIPRLLLVFLAPFLRISSARLMAFRTLLPCPVLSLHAFSLTSLISWLSVSGCAMISTNLRWLCSVLTLLCVNQMVGGVKQDRGLIGE